MIDGLSEPFIIDPDLNEWWFESFKSGCISIIKGSDKPSFIQKSQQL
jgi:hypothetical protein